MIHIVRAPQCAKSHERRAWHQRGSGRNETNLLDGQKVMSKKRIIPISLAAFAMFMAFFASASANLDPSGAAEQDSRFVNCMNLLSHYDLCKSQAMSRKSWLSKSESKACRLAQRQVAQYGRALRLLDDRIEKHRNLTPIYRQAREAALQTYKEQC